MKPHTAAIKQIGHIWVGINEIFVILSYENKEDTVFIPHHLFEQIIQWYNTGETKEDIP